VTHIRARVCRLAPESVVLLLIYAATVGLGLWQASNRLSPSIFSDELEMTQLARSFLATGDATLRGQPIHGFAPLAAYLSAPFWWIDQVPTAYMFLKAFGVLVMATAVFPAYGLARLAVTPRWALFAAAGTALSPALAYAPILVKEPTAYPAATLALFLIARWIAYPSVKGGALAVVGCVLGFLTKDQLAVLFPILGLASLAIVWRGRRASAFRRTWAPADWLGAVTLAVGIVLLCGAYIAHRSGSWYVATTFFQDRMLRFGLWAGGALAIGLGVVPLVAGLASLVRPKGEAARPGVDALAIVTVSSIIGFGVYTAVKAAYLSTVFADLILERNLIFLVPLLFAGTALFFERGGGRWWAVVIAGCFALYLVRETPYSLAQYPNYEAHGLAIIALANRIFRWPGETIQHALTTVTIVVTVALALVPRVRSHRVSQVLVVVVAAATLAWTGTAEVYAAHGENLFSAQRYATLPKPANWLDRSTQGGSVVFLGQSVKDPNPVNLLEFWNRSLAKVWALDGTAPGPGATATPNVDDPDGTLTNPHTDFAVVTPGVDLAGQPVGKRVGEYTLFKLDGRLQLRTAQTGVYPDGWMGPAASYSQYDVPPGTRGHVRVDLRQSWCGKPVRSAVLIRLGPVAISSSGQPTIGAVTSRAYGILHSCQEKSFVLPTPPSPWRVEVNIDPTFSPAELDPKQGDARQLGAIVTFTYVPSS
jgi:hypothetical protein